MAYEQNDRNDPLTSTTGGTATVPQNAGRVTNERDDSQSAAIERDIDRTRGRLDSTVDALTSRLKPSSLLDDVLDYFSSDTGTRTQSATGDKARRVAKRAGGGAWEKVKSNPVPSALIGAGIAYLFLKSDDEEATADYSGSFARGHDEEMRQRILRNNREPRMYGGSYVDARTGKPYDQENYGEGVTRPGFGETSSSTTGASGPGVMGRLKEYAGDAVEGVQDAAGYVADKASDAYDSAKSAVSGAAESTRSAASRSAGSASDYADRASSSASRYASSATDTAGSYADAAWRKTQKGYATSRDRLEDALHEKPLALGIAALAAGVLAGLVVPRSRTEDRLMGDYSHDLKGRAGDLAGETVERGKRVYEKGLSTAQGEARKQGVEPGSLQDEAAGLAQRVAQGVSRVADAAMSGAKSTAHDVAEAAKGEAQGVKQDAESRGLTPSDLADDAKQVASATASAVQDESQKQADEAKREHGTSI